MPLEATLTPDLCLTSNEVSVGVGFGGWRHDRPISTVDTDTRHGGIPPPHFVALVYFLKHTYLVSLALSPENLLFFTKRPVSCSGATAESDSGLMSIVTLSN